jgi:phosphoserine phosphatase RsbU/P
MRILVVDDERAVREALERALRLEGYEVELAEDGQQALMALAGRSADAIVLDVLMPVMDGIDTCNALRRMGNRTPVLMLTARHEVDDRVAGLDAGADDYLVKPFDRAERARLRVGERTLALQRGLADRVRELEQALRQVQRLREFLPMCAWCWKIRNDHTYWQNLESYVMEHWDARFTHGVCPECRETIMRQWREQQR